MTKATKAHRYQIAVATLQADIKAARQADDWDSALLGLRRLLKVPYRRMTQAENHDLLVFAVHHSRALVANAMKQPRKWHRGVGGIPAEDAWLLYLKAGIHLGINRAEQGLPGLPFSALSKRASRAVQLFPTSAYARHTELRLLQKWLRYETDHGVRASILNRFRHSYVEALDAASPGAQAMPRLRVAKLLYDNGRTDAAVRACARIVAAAPGNSHAVNMLKRWQNGGQQAPARRPQ